MTDALENKVGKAAKSKATQQALMHAAEKLVASKGLENVSIKEIVTAAGQKNASALQYHFQNLQGLIRSIKRARNDQTRKKRNELLIELLAETNTPTLRQLCEIMILPVVLLARDNADYRRFISSFSHEQALAPDSALDMASRSGAGGESGQLTGQLLRKALPHLQEQSFRQRMDFAVRLTSAAIASHSLEKDAFRGAESERFISHLIDAVEGLLTAPVSEQTASL